MTTPSSKSGARTHAGAPDIGLFEAIYSMRAIRRFKPDPVPGALLRTVLAAAGQAPSGGNRQPWKFIVVRSPAGKRKVSELVIAGDIKAEAARTGGQDRRPRPTGTAAALPAFGASLAHVPAIIIVCALKPVSEGPWSVGPFGQTYPAVQNLLLALRGVGLGGTITTGFRWQEKEFREYLALPDNLEPTCLIPVGFPAGEGKEHHGGKTRLPVEETTFEERHGQRITF